MTTTAQTIPKGYKQTEIGVIPADWGIEPIKQIASITTGSKNTQDRVPDGLYPFFVRSQNVERINNYSFDGEAILTAGDGVGTGKVFHYINGKFDIHQRVYKISNFNERVNGYYFFLYFSNHFYNRIMQMTAKSSVDSVRMEMIADMLVPVPQTSEQTAIATALSNADAMILKLEALIEKKKNIKQGVIQELITGKRRLPGFSGKWEEKRLDSIFRVTRGQVLAMTKTTKYKLGDYQYPVYSSQTKDNGLAGYYKDYLFENCITWTTDGANAGEVKYRTGKFYCTNVCGVLESNQGYANLCIATIFNLISRKYVSYIGNPKLMNNVVADIVITIPNSIKEQLAISEVIADMDTEIEKLESQLAKYQNLKQGMMQSLLTGKIRLI